MSELSNQLRNAGLRQMEWDKNEGDPPFGSANNAVERHNREILSAYEKGMTRAREIDSQQQMRRDTITVILYCPPQGTPFMLGDDEEGPLQPQDWWGPGHAVTFERIKNRPARIIKVESR